MTDDPCAMTNAMTRRTATSFRVWLWANLCFSGVNDCCIGRSRRAQWTQALAETVVIAYEAGVVA
jgi:hypothetical protein